MSENRLPIEQMQVLPKVKQFIPALQDDIINGKVNPLQVSIFLKKVGKIGEEIVKGDKGKEIKDLIETEIHKYQEGTKTAKAFGAEVRESNRKYYDFSECGDIVWEELNKIEKQVKELKKQREEELKLKVPKPGLGLPAINIEVSYVPKLTLEPTNDLLEIKAPTVGTNTIYSYFV
jgi:hypothetical protein